MLRTPEDEWNTALHEAGHAVAALAFGYKITGLRIVPREVDGGWFLGSIDVAEERIPNRRALYMCPLKEAENYFIFKFAGVVAEHLFSPHPCPESWKHCADYPQGDIGYCREWLEARAPGELRVYVEHIRQRTVEFLEPRRRKVEAVAQALLRQREMDGAAVSNVLTVSLFCAPPKVSAQPNAFSMSPSSGVNFA